MSRREVDALRTIALALQAILRRAARLRREVARHLAAAAQVVVDAREWRRRQAAAGSRDPERAPQPQREGQDGP